MDDQQAWQQTLVAVDEWYHGLSEGQRSQLDILVRRVMRLKEELLDFGLAAGSAEICRTCGGLCCLHGKYHVTVLDLLAYRICAAEPVSACFGDSPFCPYGCETGCLMPPRFRPMTCVIFNCDLVERRFNSDSCLKAAACERELRETIARAERVSGRRLNRPALLSGGL